MFNNLKMTPPYFKQYSTDHIQSLIKKRLGETKLGESIDVPQEESLQSFLEKTSATYIVAGIAEDIGVLANYGNAGTATAWDSFLLSFLNIQANDYLAANALAVIGHLSFDELKIEIEKKLISAEEKIQEYRKAVSIIDSAVVELIQLIVSYKKIPIIIGGGHNNAYPIIKGVALANSKAINCINLDAHIDYRLAEGRHSGNGFRYAKQEGFLEKYFVIGIHENYLPQMILREVITSEDVGFITYEDIFIHQRKPWAQALEEAYQFTKSGNLIGIELDLDCIEYLPASAATPCGVTSKEARQYLTYMASNCNVAYLHICEGIAQHDRSNLVGKLINYLVSDFVKNS